MDLTRRRHRRINLAACLLGQGSPTSFHQGIKLRLFLSKSTYVRDPSLPSQHSGNVVRR